MTAPIPPRDRFVIAGDMLCEDVGRHTCGTGPEGHYGAHEPGCGLEPVMSLEDLARMGDALSRVWFSARLHPADRGDTPRSGAGHRMVQVFAGPAGGTRGLVGVLTMRPQEADALVAVLGEAAP